MNIKLTFALMVVFLFVAGCADTNINPAPAPAQPQQSSGAINAAPEPKVETNQTTQPLGEAGVKEFRMSVYQFGFDPDTITVNKGDKVRLLLTTPDVTHGLSIDGYGIDVVVKPGQEVPVEFTASKSGSFSFYCSVFCGSGHRTMTGKLVVQ